MLSTKDLIGSTESLVRLDGEMMELVLLLPTGQAAALEHAARRQGLTSGQLTRRLIAAFLAGDRHLNSPGAAGPGTAAVLD
jgi:hypothetical protein